MDCSSKLLRLFSALFLIIGLLLFIVMVVATRPIKLSEKDIATTEFTTPVNDRYLISDVDLYYYYKYHEAIGYTGLDGVYTLYILNGSEPPDFLLPYIRPLPEDYKLPRP